MSTFSVVDHPIEDLRSTIKDLVKIEPKSFGNDMQAEEAAQWVLVAKQTESWADQVLDPAIKEAYAAHRTLTGEKKTILEKLMAARDRVRANLANWIACGHEVAYCYIQTKYRVTVVDESKVPPDFLVTTVDQKKLEDWVKTTNGQMPVEGCVIEPIHILFAKE